MHYDHAGNVPLFPKARFHVQDTEMAYCTGRAMTHAHLAAPFDAENVVDMVRRTFAGRVVFHGGDEVLYPGVSLHHLPGHTLGLQVVRVQTERGAVVLASDAIHFWANLERETPFPIVADVVAYLEALRRLRTLAPSPRSHHPGSRSRGTQAFSGRTQYPGHRAPGSGAQCAECFMSECGFIGLGRMGGAMARRLIDAGHAVIVYDPSAAAAQALAAHGATVARQCPGGGGCRADRVPEPAESADRDGGGAGRSGHPGRQTPAGVR